MNVPGRFDYKHYNFTLLQKGVVQLLLLHHHILGVTIVTPGSFPEPACYIVHLLYTLVALVNILSVRTFVDTYNTKVL